jgi:hypothetical protein
MEIINNIYFEIIFILFIFILFYLLYFLYKKITIITQIRLFSYYSVILEYYINRAYEIIHKDKILIYSLEGMHIKENEFSIISQDFVKLTIKLMGPNLYKEFINFYGNEETFIFNLIEFFNTRYENDEIRKHSIENISS